MKRLLKEYRIEIAIVLLIILGIFLLFGQINLRSALGDGFQSLQDSLDKLSYLLQEGVKYYILSVSLSKIIGWLFLILAVVLCILWIRYRFQNSSAFQAIDCPKCGDKLHRIHRKNFDRFLSRTILPNARRYQCANHECRWTGLRHPVHRHRHQQD